MLRARRLLTALLAVVGLLLATIGVASAFWTSTGSGTGQATTGMLNPPTAVTASSTAGTGVVAVGWTASVGSPAPTGYYVVRIDSGNTSFAACGTSASSTVAGTTCNDTAVPLGTYHYEAVAVDHSWTATSAPSSAVTVAKANQSITFTSSVPSNAVFRGPTYTVTATGGGSGNPVTFTIDASATTVCSISGSVVSFVGVGTCVIDANQAGSTYYNAAPQAQQSFAVAQATQTIHFTSTAPASATVGGTGYTPTASGGASGNPVTFTVDSTTSTKCSISGGVVTFQHVGSCTVDANQAGNADYSAALQVQQSFAVGQGAQAITYTSTAPSNATVNGATYTVTATGGGSGNPVTFTIDASASAVCTVSGAVVSFISGGTCVVDANQAGNTDYLAASQVQQSFTVAKASQTITFTSTAPSSAKVGGASYTPTATGGGSGNPVVFTVDASTANKCSISGGVVTFQHVGSCTVDANQVGNSAYNAAPQVQQTFTVGQGIQTITFTSTAPGSATVNGATYTVTATGGGSGNAVTFAIDASATSVCSISGAVVSFNTGGTCVIDANQAGNTDYLAANQAKQSFAVAKASQTISFTSTAPSGATVGGAGYTPTATGGGSGNAVVFTVDASTANKCTISGGVVTFQHVGSCAVDANQAGNSAYLAAPQVQQTFAIGQGAQVIAFTSTAPSSATVNGATYTVTATGGGSGNAVTFTIDASASSVCTISGAVVSFNTGGTCVIDANQAGNTDYLAAAQVQQSFSVAKASQTISFTSTAPASAKVGGSGYTPTATGGGSGNPVTFTIDATTSTKCSISGGVVTFQHVGSCTVDANQAGNNSYNPALQVQQSFAIGQGAQAIAFTSTAPSNATVNGATYTVTATGGGSGNAVSFTIDASATSVCSISGAVVSFTAGGTCVIDANQGGNADYLAASQVQQSFSVAKASQTITTFTTPTTGAVGGTGSVSASASSGLSVTFSSATTSICTVSGSTVTYVAVGTCTVNADQSGNGSYTAAPQVQRSVSVDAAQFSVTAGATQVAGTAFTVTITAQDTGGSTVPSYNGSHTITLTSTAGNSPSGATPTLPSGSLTFTNGVATVSVTLVAAETGRTISASDGTASGTSNNITVNAGSAAKLAWTHVTVSKGTLSNPCLFTCSDSGLGGTGGSFTANVSVTDALGNTVSGLGVGHTVTVSSSGGAFTAPTAGSSVTLTISGSGAADSTQQFSFTSQTGSWTSDGLTASTASGTTYVGASATLTKA